MGLFGVWGVCEDGDGLKIIYKFDIDNVFFMVLILNYFVYSVFILFYI